MIGPTAFRGSSKRLCETAQPSFVIDGEAVLLGVDGISDFNGLHSRRHNDEVQLYAFDILALEGEDLRKQPLHLRKNNLARLLASLELTHQLSQFMN